MKKGDIILIPVPFTDLSGNKNRPAVILIESPSDITVSFITSRLSWKDEHDLILQATSQNGLKCESVLKLSKIATLEKNLAIGRLGTLSQADVLRMNESLIALLQLNPKFK